MKFFFYGIGAVALICALLAAIPFALWLVIWIGFSTHTLNTLQEKDSPYGTYVATSYVDTGGGAAGWCMAEVNVRRAGTELLPNEEIFTTHCGTHVDLFWDAETVLRIRFTPDDADFGVTQYGWTKDRSVKIIYLEGKPIPKL